MVQTQKSPTLQSCFHSTLHPAGAERAPVPDHPETLFVAAKKQKLRLIDVQVLLEGLGSDISGFERSDPPRFAREPRSFVCWSCGEEGHLARDCHEF